jgi:F420-dependent oxidoreductase-like protein
VQLAVHYPNFTRPGGPEAIAPTLAATARAAEQAGVTTLTLMDHWFQMEQMAPATDPMLEGYTGLGFLAGQTESISLGLLVTGVTYRHPGLLAKTVTTLDVLSGGRAIFGIGAAWYEREHKGLGVEFPPTATRFELLDEAIQVVRQMWSDDEGPYSGTHYQLAETICRPKPIQQPPPTMIGGTGERKTLRLAAQYADIVNWAVASPEEAAHKLDVLRGHCDAVGRDVDEIELTIIGGSDPLGDTDAFLGQMEAYAKVGIDTVFVSAMSEDPAGWVTQLGERVVDRLRELD